MCNLEASSYGYKLKLRVLIRFYEVLIHGNLTMAKPSNEEPGV